MNAQVQIWKPVLSHFREIVRRPQFLRSRYRGVRCYSLKPSNGKSSAVIWFKQDLRIDDHPGIDEASRNHGSVVPLYVFDYRILHRYSDDMLELLLIALGNFRESLQRNGSNLMIRVGRAEDIISNLILQVDAINLFVEEEIDHHLRELIATVEDKITSSGFRESTKVIHWRTPFFESDEVTHKTQNYDEFAKQELNFSSPIRFNKISCVPTELEWGTLPSLSKLKEFIDNNRVNSNFQLQVTYTDSILLHKTKSLLTNLAEYLRHFEEHEQEISQEKIVKLISPAILDGSSFQNAFCLALRFGVISRRRLHFEALKITKPNSGIRPLKNPASKALFALRSSEWYTHLARSSVLIGAAKIWRWNGFLIQYTCHGEEGPAVVLVHGFGAFLNHFRDNISALSDAGNRVWALTLVGFGRSEKPNILYTELKWAELVRDFIVEVINEPVHLVGNSIGGYVVAIVTHWWPHLVKSVVLINTAGELTSKSSSLKLTNEREIPGIGKLFAPLLLLFLRLTIRSTVKSCYPVKPERVDDWLINEMLRASSDPGGVTLMECVFGLNLSLPLNLLLKEKEGFVLVIQGMRDPLVNSKKRVALFEEHCGGILIKKLDAGHCPHDELPEEVNSFITHWLLTIER